MSATQWLLLVMAGAVGVFVVTWCTRRRSFFAQFLVLLSIGVCISFLLLMIIQLPKDRPWLATLLVVSVFLASPIAVRLFLRGVCSEEEHPSEEGQSNSAE